MNISQTPTGTASTEPLNAALLTALTTEHYTLQSARASTVAEANGRSLLFLSAVSGATVALALVAQLPRLGDTFMVFALSVLPALLALGLTSYARLADLAVHDACYARAIGRIRSYYFTIAPSPYSWSRSAPRSRRKPLRSAQPRSPSACSPASCSTRYGAGADPTEPSRRSSCSRAARRHQRAR
jgi:hypothetical protein